MYDQNPQEEVAKLRQELEEVKRMMREKEDFQLKYPLDDNSIKVLNDVILRDIQDIVWNKYFHYLSFYENVQTNVSGNYSWELVDNFGTSAMGAEGVNLATGATSGNNAYISKYPEFQNFISFDYDSRFRTMIYIADDPASTSTTAVTNTRAWVGNGGGLDANGDPLVTNSRHYGFWISDTTMYGVTCNGTSETQVPLVTDLKFGHVYQVEARLERGFVMFFVSNGVAITDFTDPDNAIEPVILRSSTTETIPSGYSKYLGVLEVMTKTTDVRSLRSTFFEFLQLRKT
jgi:hypothetical protein